MFGKICEFFTSTNVHRKPTLVVKRPSCWLVINHHMVELNYWYLKFKTFGRREVVKIHPAEQMCEKMLCHLLQLLHSNVFPVQLQSVLSLSSRLWVCVCVWGVYVGVRWGASVCVKDPMNPLSDRWFSVFSIFIVLSEPWVIPVDRENTPRDTAALIQLSTWYMTHEHSQNTMKYGENGSKCDIFFHFPSYLLAFSTNNCGARGGGLQESSRISITNVRNLCQYSNNVENNTIS